jgi:hypothetical protein
MRLGHSILSIFLFLHDFMVSGISGKYKVSGTQTNGEHYRGTAVIQHIGKSMYTITCSSLFAFFENASARYGVEMYTISDNTLTGIYTRFVQKRTGFETLKKFKKGEEG